MRTVSVLTVDEPALIDQIALAVPLDDHTLASPSPTERIVDPRFDRTLPELERRGLSVLVRQARRTQAEVSRARTDVQVRVDHLSDAARACLDRALRHARDQVVLGVHVFDPVTDDALVGELVRAELIAPLEDAAGDTPQGLGRYVLHPDLPPPPTLAWNFEDAVMAETEDLVSIAETGDPNAALGTGPVDLLHDVASLAAAFFGWHPKRTLAGPIAKADGRRLGRRLGVPDIEARGALASDPRWGQALRAIEALGALSLDAVTRELHLDLGLEDVLAGDTADAVDRLVQRLVDADLRPLLPVVRQALGEAGGQALDEVVLADLIREQHRDLVFRSWHRQGHAWYPVMGDAVVRPYDDEGFDQVERPMLEALLRRLHRLGVIRRAPGVFAASEDGRQWARVADPSQPPPPVWVSSDLEVVVPPHSVTPWQRMQIERLGRCIGRDVVDRFRIEKTRVRDWLAHHDIDEALELLRDRAYGLPVTVEETLSTWARSAERIVLVRGVLAEERSGGWATS